MTRQIKHFDFSYYISVLVLMLGLSTPALAADKPNIVVIFGDDVGMWNVGV